MGMRNTFFLIRRKCVQTDVVNAVENTLFNIGIIPLQPTQKRLDLLALGSAATVIAYGTVFCETAGALDELQLVVPFPGKDVLLPGSLSCRMGGVWIPDIGLLRVINSLQHSGSAGVLAE